MEELLNRLEELSSQIAYFKSKVSEDNTDEASFYVEKAINTIVEGYNELDYVSTL